MISISHDTPHGGVCNVREWDINQGRGRIVPDIATSRPLKTRPHTSTKRRFYSVAAFAALLVLHGTHAIAADVIVLAQVLPLSGSNGQMARELDEGRRACVALVNARGGVNGRKIELRTRDDGGIVERALAATQQWVEDRRVVGLLGPMGPEGNEGVLRAAAAAGLLVVGPQGGDVGSRLQKGPEPTAVFLTANQSAEAQTLVAHLRTLGLTRVFIVSSAGAAGAAATTAFEEAMGSTGLAPAGIVDIKADGSDAPAKVDAMLRQNPHAVLLATTGTATIATLDALNRPRNLGGRVLQSYGMSSSLTLHELQALRSRASGLTMTQVLPSFEDPRPPVVATYRSAMQAAGFTPSYVSLEGCLSVLAMANILGKSSGAPDRPAVLKAARAASTTDLGGYSVDLRPSFGQIDGRIDIMYVSADGRIVR